MKVHTKKVPSFMKIVSKLHFFKDLELEMAKVVETCDKDIEMLKEKLMKKEQECEAEKAMLNKEKQEREKSESHTKEMMRNLM